MKNLLVAQSGGPTVAINASLAGVINAARNQAGIDKIYGAVYGIEGVLSNHLAELNHLNLDLLKQTPAAYLGSCRKKLPDCLDNPEIYQQFFSIFQEYNIGYFLYIGGNDSMDTVLKLSDYAKEHKIDVNVIGIPKTIDNDLAVTDHTPGFGSAAKYVATTVAEIAADSMVYDLKSVTIVEIMGRHAGWLTGASALARTDNRNAPHLIYLPEVAFSKEQFVKDIQSLFDKGIHQVIVAVSEGIKDENGILICEGATSATDSFGHAMLSGAGKALEHFVKAELSCKARSVELNVCQRSAGHLLSKTDIDEAFAIGEAGVCQAVKGHSGEMMVFHRIADMPYQMKIESVDVHRCANLEKCVPKEWIANSNDVTDELITYLKPLILGEVSVTFDENGLPRHLHR